MINAEQLRAARALLRLEQQELARRAGISVATLRRLEAANGTARVPQRTVEAAQQALEMAGAEFIPDGVRRRLRTPDEIERRFRGILAAAVRVSALAAQNPEFSEDDLYDETGLPR